jgi:hypothetical protein
VSYLSGMASTGDVWRQRIDGSGTAERLLRSQRPLSEQVWSPLGNALIVRTTTGSAGVGDILLIHPGVDSAPTPLVTSAHSEYSPSSRLTASGWPTSRTKRGGTSLRDAARQSERSEVGDLDSGGSSPRWSHRGMSSSTSICSRTLCVRASQRCPRYRAEYASALQRLGFRSDLDLAPELRCGRGRPAVPHGPARGRRKRGQVVVVEHWAEEIRRRPRN